MESILKNLVGRKVSVWSGHENNRDDGMLDAYDDQFIRLRQDNAQELYFPIASMRLIKPIR